MRQRAHHSRNEKFNRRVCECGRFIQYTALQYIDPKSVWCHTYLWSSLVSLLTLGGYPLLSKWDLEPTLPITGGHLNNYRTEKEDAMHQTHRPQIVKAHMSAVEFDSDPRLAGNETGGWGVSQPLAFVNCMSHIVLAGTVNWKRSRGFAVLMSFPWTQVILWIPEEPLLSPTFTDPSVRAKLFISGVMRSLPHLLCLVALAQRGINGLL